MTKWFLATVTLLAYSATPAMATVLEDFESGYAGPGTVITDPADPANSVLHLVSNAGVDDVASEIFAIDTNGFVGTVTMDIYDFGATTWDGASGDPGTDHGPRWGIQGDGSSDGTLDNWVAAGIMNKPWPFDANQGYAFVHDDIAGDGQRAVSFNGDWFTLNFFGNPRRAKTDPPGFQPIPGDGLQLIGTGTAEVPEVAGSGAWTTWEFVVDGSGNVSITAREGTEGKFLDAPFEADTQTQYDAFGGSGPVNMTVLNMKQIWVTGGQGGDVGAGSIVGTHGVLVDNVTFDGVVSSVDGDYNDTGLVEQGDLDLVLLNWGATWPPEIAGWVNQQPTDDGLVDQNDLDGVLLNWGNSSSVAAAPVPEPASLLLLILGAVACLRGARRRR